MFSLVFCAFGTFFQSQPLWSQRHAQNWHLYDQRHFLSSAETEQHNNTMYVRMTFQSVFVLCVVLLCWFNCFHIANDCFQHISKINNVFRWNIMFGLRVPLWNSGWLCKTCKTQRQRHVPNCTNKQNQSTLLSTASKYRWRSMFVQSERITPLSALWLLLHVTAKKAWQEFLAWFYQWTTVPASQADVDQCFVINKHSLLVKDRILKKIYQI